MAQAKNSTKAKTKTATGDAKKPGPKKNGARTAIDKGAKDAAKAAGSDKIAEAGKVAKARSEPITALDLPRAELSPETAAYFKKCEEKIGFIPNVLLAYAHDGAKLDAFSAMYNDLMLAPSGLSKLEREMIAVVVSAQNRCFYCLTAHGAAVRQLAALPEAGEVLVMNYRAGHFDKRVRRMLDFAVKLTVKPDAMEEKDRKRLRKAGFTDRDIWDIAAVAAFFNMSNRIAAAVDMRPNAEYHAQAR